MMLLVTVFLAACTSKTAQDSTVEIDTVKVEVDTVKVGAVEVKADTLVK